MVKKCEEALNNSSQTNPAQSEAMKARDTILFCYALSLNNHFMHGATDLPHLRR